MLLKLFRSLMPRDDVFVSHFSAHAAKGVDAAKAFGDLLSVHRINTVGVIPLEAQRQAEVHYAALCEVEEAADAIARDTAKAIHQVFVTPFDRSDILALSTALDDVIDLMKDAAQRVRLYRVGITPEMMRMAGCIDRACAQLRDGVPLLNNVSGNAERLQEMCRSVRSIEREADDARDEGLRFLFGPGNEMSPGGKLTVERVYDLIEEVVDRCEDLVDVVEGIVIEQV